MIDVQKTRDLAESVGRLVNDHLQRGPASPDRVYEALNALAFVAAMMIVGTNSQEAREMTLTFLELAVRENVADVLQSVVDRGGVARH